MLQFSAIGELGQAGKDLHLALGVFDGVHLGHQAVIGRAVEGAKASGGAAGVLTFEPHPIQVLAPEQAPRQILASLEHKKRLVEALGVEFVVILPFTKEFSRREAGDFAAELLAAPGLKQLTLGEDWRFGRERAGTVGMLREMGAERGVEVNALTPVMLAGERISSTRVRQALRDGNLAGAAAMLGRPYTVYGTVVRGDQLGRKLGVPTANIEVGNEQLPPDGVYAVQALATGGWCPGVANLGVRPTVDGSRRLLEVHLFDFEGDLYGEEVEVQFGVRLRPERKFEDLEGLTAQILEDVDKGKMLFEQGGAMEV